MVNQNYLINQEKNQMTNNIGAKENIIDQTKEKI